MDTKEKFMGTVQEGQKKKIVVTHITIRQSISFLLMRLIVIEAIAAGLLIGFRAFIFVTGPIIGPYDLLNIPLFIFLVLIKTLLVIYVILQWLNEYYEITPTRINHKSGILWVHEDSHEFNDVKSISLKQGAFGRFFNYGTIEFFDWKEQRRKTMYLVHNPMKYFNILQTLIPKVETDKDVFREHLIEPNDDTV